MSKFSDVRKVGFDSVLQRDLMNDGAARQQTSDDSVVLTGLDLSDPRTLNKLVSSLMYLFHFSSKAELAFILGYPSALNNQQVLCNWIGDKLKQADWVEPDELLSFLVTRLKRELMQWQEVA